MFNGCRQQFVVQFTFLEFNANEMWMVTKQYGRLPEGSRMFDVACAENNRNPVDATGRTLTLDAEGNVLDVDVNTGVE